MGFFALFVPFCGQYILHSSGPRLEAPTFGGVFIWQIWFSGLSGFGERIQSGKTALANFPEKGYSVRYPEPGLSAPVS
jgi:hypothetical protein